MIAISMKDLLDRLNGLGELPESATVEVNNSRMLLFPRKGAIHQDLFVYRKREPISTDYLIKSRILKKGDTVLDIGANIGYYVLIESQLVGENGKVYAVEPVRGNFDLLKKNVLLNNLKNVDTFQLAFGEDNKESTIYVSNFCNLSSMKKNTTIGKIIDAQSVTEQTVDTFLKNKVSPSLIRMDVEGYEYEILKGMLQTLKGKVRILAELHPCNLYEEKIKEIFQILTQNNFYVRFAVYEPKIKENETVNKIIDKIVDDLLKKAKVRTPIEERALGIDFDHALSPTIVLSNVSLQEFQETIKEHPNLAPNVLFEKQS
jgi:FkbM family methyltransferase